MVQFDLIGQLNTSAKSKGWHFIYGNNHYVNYEATIKKIYAGDFLLTADFSCVPIIKNGLVTEITYTGLIMLGVSMDDNGQKANLDETMQQKYDRRLLELMQTLANYIGEFACLNELDVNITNMRLDINRTDTNIDFIVAELSFVQ